MTVHYNPLGYAYLQRNSSSLGEFSKALNLYNQMAKAYFNN